MPPTRVHFNGGVNLPDTQSVFREISTHVPAGVSRIPDGETGDRQQWIFFQMGKFMQTPGLVAAGVRDQLADGYEQFPQVRLADGTSADDVAWPDLGYAAAYGESYAIFRRMQDEGTIPAGVRFQLQYPTPLASISAWVVTEEQDVLHESYRRALFADLDKALAALPHHQVAVQWDVAVEFGLLEEGGFQRIDGQGFDAVLDTLVRCVDQVPADVPVGLHLCYGDYQHQHFVQPESLGMQVRVVNELTARAGRPVNWFSFTVPQDRRDEAYFSPLAELRAGPDTELYFALVAYHPDSQPAGTTAEQVRLIDQVLPVTAWGICTECGMARAEQEEIPGLLDQHREILATYGAR